MATDCPTCGRRMPGTAKREERQALACEVCGKPVAYQGRGKPRRCCPECRGVRAKLRRESVRAH